MAMRPPGFNSRNASLNTLALSERGTRFTTQLLMMQSAMASGRGMEVIEASTKDKLKASTFWAFFRANSSILCQK